MQRLCDEHPFAMQSCQLQAVLEQLLTGAGMSLGGEIEEIEGKEPRKMLRGVGDAVHDDRVH